MDQNLALSFSVTVRREDCRQGRHFLSAGNLTVLICENEGLSLSF